MLYHRRCLVTVLVASCIAATVAVAVLHGLLNNPPIVSENRGSNAFESRVLRSILAKYDEYSEERKREISSRIEIATSGDTYCLLELSENDEEMQIRLASIKILAIQARENPIAFTHLCGLLKDASPQIRLETAIALGHFSDPRPILPLSKALEIETDLSVKLALCNSLSLHCDETARKEIINLMRKGIISWDFPLEDLAERYGSVIVPELVAILGEGHYRSAEMAAKCLGRIQDESSVDILVALAVRSDDDVKYYALKALSSFKNEKCLEAYIDGFQSGDYSCKVIALKAITEMKSSRSEDLLCWTLDNDTVPEFRRLAAEGLAKYSTQRTLDTLIAALNDCSDVVTETAAKSLGEIGDKKSIEPLLFSVSEFWRSYRGSIAEVLKKMMGQDVVSVLIPLLKYNYHDEDDKRAILLILKTETKQRMGWDLNAWQEWYKVKEGR